MRPQALALARAFEWKDITSLAGMLGIFYGIFHGFWDKSMENFMGYTDYMGFSVDFGISKSWWIVFSVSIQDSPMCDPVKNAICDSSTLKKLDLPKPKKPLDLLRFQPHFFSQKSWTDWGLCWADLLHWVHWCQWSHRWGTGQQALLGAWLPLRGGLVLGGRIFPQRKLVEFSPCQKIGGSEMYFGATYFEGQSHRWSAGTPDAFLFFHGPKTWRYPWVIAGFGFPGPFKVPMFFFFCQDCGTWDCARLCQGSAEGRCGPNCPRYTTNGCECAKRWVQEGHEEPGAVAMLNAWTGSLCGCEMMWAILIEFW